jgi:hypothetical protein
LGEIHTEPETYTVKLGWAGEILDVSYEPLSTRATTDDLYGIQVYSAPANGFEEWTPYALGLFDDPNNISIKLLGDHKYKFVSTMIKNGKNLLQEDSGGYYYPFQTNLHSWSTESMNNKFDYKANEQFTALQSGHVYLNATGYHSHPNIDRFYGELDGYIPGNEDASAKINMKRTVFGAKFIASGKLADSGILHVNMTDAPEMTLTLTDNDDEIFDIFTFSNIYSAWLNDEYAETISVSISWERPDGTIMPLGSHNITYKRNETTVVTVNIENETNEGAVGFEFAESETGTPVESGENDVTITDGDVVDTEVETN